MIGNSKFYTFILLFLCNVLQLHSQTTLNPGDLAIVGVNSNNNACTSDGYNGPGEDNIYFVCFKDIETGTVIDFTDNGWERLNVDQWGDNEGVFRGTYDGTTIPAGTVFSLIFRQSATDADMQNADWSFIDINFTPRWLNLNSTGDQIYTMQNGEWVDGDDVLNTHDAVYEDGNMIYAFNTKVDWLAP